MKKLLATFAILALCAVNAMAADTQYSKEATVSVTVQKYSEIKIATDNITLDLDTFDGTNMTGESDPVAVTTSANFAAGITVELTQSSPNYLTLNSSVSSAASLGVDQPAGSFTVSGSVPLSAGTTAPTGTVTATISAS